MRSYLGIGSCCMFAIATGYIVAWQLVIVDAGSKMAGFEGIFVVPFAILLYVTGAIMGFAGLRRPTANPLSRTGVALNLVPLFFVWLVAMWAVLCRLGHPFRWGSKSRGSEVV